MFQLRLWTRPCCVEHQIRANIAVKGEAFGTQIFGFSQDFIVRMLRPLYLKRGRLRFTVGRGRVYEIVNFRQLLAGEPAPTQLGWQSFRVGLQD
jgi:hypothetical protein